MNGWQIFFLTLAVGFVLVMLVRLMYRVFRLEKILRDARDRLNDPDYE